MPAEIIAFLLGLTCFLTFVTVVGHGLWVVIAKGVEWLSGTPNKQPPPPVQFIPPSPKADPAIIARYARRLLERGLIDQATCDTLLDAIQREQMGVRYKGEGDRGPGIGEAEKFVEEPGQPNHEPVAANELQLAAAIATAEPEIINAEIVFDPPPLVAAIASDSPFAPRPPVAHAPGSLVSPFRAQPPVPSPKPPPPPARSFADMLQAFLEESNIRWGEVLAGLFIVVSSVGLVVSLRNTLKQIPYFPALLFLTFTLAFHGAGLYSLRRWNLRSVSRAVLIISLLLVPLCFAAAIVLSGPSAAGHPPWHPLFLLTTTAGLVGGAWVAWSSAKEVATRSAATLTAAVLGTSASQVLIHRAVTTETSPGWLIALALVPTAFFLAAALDQVWQAWRLKQLSWQRAQPLLLTAGIGLFALILPLVLLISQASSVRDALAWLSPVLCLPAAAILAIGSLLHQRSTARSLGQLKTAGTAIAIFAGVVLLLCLIAAWPQPGLLISVALVNAACLIALAIIADLPPLSAAGAACLAIAAVIGLHWSQGRLESDEFSPGVQIVRAVVSGRSAVLLAIIGAAYGALGGWLVRNRKADGQSWLVSALSLAVVCLLLALYIGFAPEVAAIADPSLATPLLLGFAIALLGVGRAFPHIALAFAGSAALWAGLVHALWRCEPARERLAPLHLLPERPVVGATLLFATIAALLALEVSLPKFWAVGLAYTDWRKSKPFRHWLLPLSIVSLVASVVVLPWLVWVKPEQLGLHAACWIAAGLVWLILAYAHREPVGVTAFQVAATLAALHVVARWHYLAADGGEWFWTGPHLAQQIAAVALAAIAWCLLRRFSPPLPVTHHLANPAWPGVDQVLLPLAAFGMLFLARATEHPGVLIELAFATANEMAADTFQTALTISPAHWWACGALLIAALVAAWERWRIENAVWLLVATVIPFILPAAYAANEIAVASTLRWLLAGHVLLATSAVVLRNQLAGLWRMLPGGDVQHFSRDYVTGLELLALGLGGLPIIAITIAAVVQGTNGTTLAGPLETSFLGGLGMTLNYGLPLLAIVGGCLALAIREQQAGYAFGGFVVFQVAANLALLLTLSHMPGVTASTAGAMALQWNLIASAVYGLLWRGLARWIEPGLDLAAPRPWLDALRRPRLANGPVVLSVLLVRILAFWCVAQIFLSPHFLARGEEQLGDATSYVGWALTLGLMALRTRRTASGWFDTGLLAAAALVGIVAATIDGLDTARHWHAFHALEFAWLALTIAATAGLWLAFPQRAIGPDASAAPRDDSTFIPRLVWGGILIGGLSLLFALRGVDIDPWKRWLPLGTTLAVCLAYFALGVHRRRQGIAWLQAAVTLLLASLLWFQWGRGGWFFTEWPPLWSSLALGGCASAIAWLLAELHFDFHEQRPFDPQFRGPATHRGLTFAVLPLLGLATAYHTLELLSGSTSSINVWPEVILVVGALVATGVLLVGSLWDRGARYAFPCLYAWGGMVIPLLVAIGFRIAQPTVWLPSGYLVAVTLAFAGYVTLLSHFFHRGPKLVVLGQSWGIPDPLAGLVRLDRWLPGLNAALSVMLSGLAFLEVLAYGSRGERIAASLVPALVAWGVAALAQERRRMLMQQLALFLAAGTVVLMGWADLDPSHTAAFWLERTIRLLLALGLVAFVYSLAAPKWIISEGDWPVAFRRAGALAGALAVAALVAVLGLELALYEPGKGAPVETPQVIIVSLVLVGLIAGLLAIALAPERDPLNLSEAGRMGYVYGAQVVLVLLIVHLHLARPALFSTIRPYWPYAMLTVALAWGALGEYFRRQGRAVLAEPLAHTAAALPLLPVVGYWLVGSGVDYAAVLFVAALLYGVLAQQKQSIFAGLAAAAAGNAALWVLWSRQDLLAFWSHPQLWLIPPAASALVAAQVNRQRLNAEALTGIRYVSLIVIYLSSTSELFLKGAGESLWPPVILSCIAVAGAAAGVMLRIRAFLYLGSGFALIALVSMVWHASRAIEHVWPWWAFGIGMGIAILVLFGVFEKRRAEMMGLVERLRQWEQ